MFALTLPYEREEALQVEVASALYLLVKPKQLLTWRQQAVAEREWEEKPCWSERERRRQLKSGPTTERDDSGSS